MDKRLLDWVNSLEDDGVTEIAVLAPVKRGRVSRPPGSKGELQERQTYEQRVRGIVASLQDRVNRGVPHVLSKVPTIHFGRIIFLRPEQYHDTVSTAGSEDGEEYSTHVLTLVEFHGDIKVYFRDIATILARDFDKLFENCENYPGTRSFEKFWLWIKRYQVPTSLFLSPYSNLSVARIKQLEDFRKNFDGFVETSRAGNNWPNNFAELFEQFLRENLQKPNRFPTSGGTYE